MRELTGYTMILCAAFFWGVSGTLAKVLLNNRVDTLLIVQTRVTFSFLLFLIWFLVISPATLRVLLRDLWRFAMLGIIGVAGSNFTYYSTIRESTVATAILLQYTAPFLVMGYAVLSGMETLTLVKFLAGVGSLCGCFLAVGGYESTAVKITSAALLTGCGSALCFAFLNIAVKRMLERYSMWTVTFYSLAFASVFWMVVHPLWGSTERVQGELWGILVLFAVVSILIPHSLFFGGMRHVVPSRAVIISTFEPVTAIVSSAIILAEPLAPAQIAGVVIVLSCIVLLELKREIPSGRSIPSRVES